MFLVNPGKPLNLSGGGIIPHLPGAEKYPGEDTLLSKLEAGSLVVPVKAVKHMADFKGPITGPIQTRKEKLVSAVTLPAEMVVHRKHASRAERHLAKKGIRLPLGS